MGNVTHYPSSKGLMEITKMAYPHITNAIAKIEREGGDVNILEALKARRDELDLARAEAKASNGQS